MTDPSLADRLAELRKASWHPARTFLPAEWDDVVNKAVEALRTLDGLLHPETVQNPDGSEASFTDRLVWTNAGLRGDLVVKDEQLADLLTLLADAYLPCPNETYRDSDGAMVPCGTCANCKLNKLRGTDDSR